MFKKLLIILFAGTLVGIGIISWVRLKQIEPKTSSTFIKGRKVLILAGDLRASRAMSWSPDGSKVVALSIDKQGNYRIYRMEADGSDRKLLFDWKREKLVPTYVSWSPDGSRILLTAYGAPQNIADIYTIAPDGSNLENLTRFSVEEVLGVGSGKAGLGDPFDPAPKWRPDGSTILYKKNDDLWLMDRDGNNKQKITSGISIGGFSWSPNGSKIVYTVTKEVEPGVPYKGSLEDIWIMDVDGENRYELVAFQHHSFSPVFSPDSSQITFISSKGEPHGWHLWKVNVDGSNAQQLTKEEDEFITEARWSPDGKKIAFIRKHRMGGRSLWIMDVDGGNQEEVLPRNGFGPFRCLSWSSDSKQLRVSGGVNKFIIVVML